MNISKEVKDNLTAVLKIQINKEDYEPRVDKVLEDYRKKARIDGFRPGKVPAGLVKKMYGKSILLDEINKILSENLSKYIEDEHIHILGDPLPSEKEQKEINWDTQTEFEFAFEIGLSPEFEVNLSKKNKLTYYSISADEKLINTYKDNYARRYGAFKSCDEISSGKEMIKGTFVEMDGNAVKDGGISVSESSIYLEFMKDEDTKAKLTGLKQGDTITFNLRKAYPNDVELASILKMKKEQVTSVDSDFQLTIEAVSLFENAALNTELYDKIYGEGIVKSDEEFIAKIKEEIEANLSRESEYKFRLDAKETLLDKTTFDLPVEFLKRWIFSSNEGKFTMEQIETDFPKFERDMKWQLIQNKLIKDQDLKLTDEEILDFAKQQTRVQFEQYGLFNVPDEHILNYAQESLKRDEDRRRIIERKYEEKVLEYIREAVTIQNKDVTPEEFDKLLDENSK